MQTKSRGFTLVEVLVISPIVILFILFFIALLVNLTGESLVARERNVTAYDSQTALDDVESSVNQAVQFLTTTSGAGVVSPQGKDNATAAFTNTNGANPDTLIMKLAATTKVQTDPTRTLIYAGNGTCNSANPLYTYLVIYFVAADPDTPDPTDKALFKRTILPQQPACATPVQLGSCQASIVPSNTTICKTRDELLVSGVSALNISYFDANGSALSDSQAALSTEARTEITVSKQVGGKSILYTASSQVKSFNAQN